MEKLRRIRMPLMGMMFIALLMAGCESDSVINGETPLLVVEAYLFAGQPVTHIRLSESYGIAFKDSTAPPVNTAQVSLIRDGNRYPLEIAAGDSGWYHYTGPQLNIAENDFFLLEIEYQGEVVTAETTVPSAPYGLVLDDSTLEVADFSDFIPGGDFDPQSTMLTLEWTGEENALYYVVIENLEEDPEEIGENGIFMGKGPGRFITEPNPLNHYRIGVMAVTHFGRHRAQVFRVNQEYADLYQSRQQDTRDLNEPATNIDGGLGIFSAFNSATVLFTVVPSE